MYIHIYIYISEMHSEVSQLCPTLSNPMDCSLPGFSVHGIFQAGTFSERPCHDVPTSPTRKVFPIWIFLHLCSSYPLGNDIHSYIFSC